MTITTRAATLSGRANAAELVAFLELAESQKLYGRLCLEGGAEHGSLVFINGRIALEDANNIEGVRRSQHRTIDLLRKTVAANGTYRCDPLLGMDNVDTLRSVSVGEVLVALRLRDASTSTPSPAKAAGPSAEALRATPVGQQPTVVRSRTGGATTELRSNGLPQRPLPEAKPADSAIAHAPSEPPRIRPERAELLRSLLSESNVDTSKPLPPTQIANAGDETLSAVVAEKERPANKRAQGLMGLIRKLAS